MENQETLDAIAAEVRARAKAWPDPSLVQYDERLADRITDAGRRGHINLDALERACEEVLDAETLKAVVAAKRRIQGEQERESVCRRSIQIPVEVVPTCSVAAMREALGFIRAELHNNTIIARNLKHRLFDIADSALAKPPRNCDRFGGDIDKLREACARERGLNPEEDFPDVFPDWLLAPSTAKESGVRK